MKIKHLISILKKENPEMEIWHYNPKSGRYHPGVTFYIKRILKAGYHFTDNEEMWVEGPEDDNNDGSKVVFVFD